MQQRTKFQFAVQKDCTTTTISAMQSAVQRWCSYDFMRSVTCKHCLTVIVLYSPEAVTTFAVAVCMMLRSCFARILADTICTKQCLQTDNGAGWKPLRANATKQSGI